MYLQHQPVWRRSTCAHAGARPTPRRLASAPVPGVLRSATNQDRLSRCDGHADERIQCRNRLLRTAGAAPIRPPRIKADPTVRIFACRRSLTGDES